MASVSAATHAAPSWQPRKIREIDGERVAVARETPLEVALVAAEPSEVVIEGAVLLHQDDDVFRLLSPLYDDEDLVDVQPAAAAPRRDRKHRPVCWIWPRTSGRTT